VKGGLLFSEIACISGPGMSALPKSMRTPEVRRSLAHET
jgi:hypothetical protein